MRREIENRKKCCVTHCTKFMPESAINACMKVPLNISSAPGKSVAVPPQPGCRNSGKTETRLCSQIEQERRNRVRKWAAKCEAGMNSDKIQRIDLEQGREAKTRAYSPTTQRLQARYSLTVRRRRLIKWPVGK